jgi:tetratricopeptide (TPR) repeat protein
VGVVAGGGGDPQPVLDEPEPVHRLRWQLAMGGSDETPELLDEWVLSWLAKAAELLVSQAPQVAAELLRQGVASSPAGARHDRLATRLADALYRVGDVTGAERMASHVLVHAVEPDLLVDLYWTLAQCRMRKGSLGESVATMERALAVPGISARHRSRLLVLAARAHCYFGEIEKAAEVAMAALAMASEAGDDRAIAWALHVLTLVSLEAGRLTDALPLFDRALTATQADPALTDLRLLLQINKSLPDRAMGRRPGRGNDPACRLEGT